MELFAFSDFPMCVHVCACSHRFFLQLWSENFLNHKPLTMEIFNELTTIKWTFLQKSFNYQNNVIIENLDNRK